MDKVEKKVFAFVKEQHMIRPRDRLVAGVSGGADSVCLLYLLLQLKKEIPFELLVVHVNHGLRGADALADQEYVRNLCRREQVPFSCYPVDVRTLARQKGCSLEEAGRMARYEIFEREAAEQGKIVLAHHQDDLAETMLHHLARGTGLAGLCSLRPVNGRRIRPLLCLTREEIENWLTEKGIRWQTDATNLDDTYTRNKLRHHVVAYLREEINPRAVVHMAETAQELRETEELVETLLAERRERCMRKEDSRILLLSQIREEPALLRQRMVLMAFKEVSGSFRDFTRKHCQDVEQLWEKPVGRKIHLPGHMEAVRTYEGIRIRKTESASEEREEAQVPVLQVPGQYRLGDWQITCEILSNNLPAIVEKTYTKWLDYDKIKGSLIFRHRRDGDRLALYPEGKGKKLKDYLIDRKIPREERDQLWLLADDTQILWVVGDRLSEKYKVTGQTEKVLQIQIKGGNIHE